MTEIAMRKQGGRLVPVDDMSAEEMARLPVNKDLLVTVRAPRNLRHHRLAWALAQKLSDACDFLPDRESAMEFLKLKARHIRLIHDALGRTHILPRSISFAAMDQAAFTRLFDRMVWIVCNEIIPGLEEKALRAEILSMVGGEPPPERHPSNPGGAHEVAEQDSHEDQPDPTGAGPVTGQAGGEPATEIQSEAQHGDAALEQPAEPKGDDPEASAQGSHSCDSGAAERPNASRPPHPTAEAPGSPPSPHPSPGDAARADVPEASVPRRPSMSAIADKLRAVRVESVDEETVTKALKGALSKYTKEFGGWAKFTDAERAAATRIFEAVRDNKLGTVTMRAMMDTLREAVSGGA
jgi:hypothetical protein